jgi:hypothetical protein
MRYGRKNGKGSTKSLLRRRRRRAASRRLALYPTPEFKTVRHNLAGWQKVGQCYGLEHNGAFGHRIDPQIGHGLVNGQRIGDWITLKSMFFDMQFRNQSAANLTNRLIVDVWLKDKGQLIDPHPYADGHTHPLTGNSVEEQGQIAAYIFENNWLVSNNQTLNYSDGVVGNDGTDISGKGKAPDDVDARFNTIDIGSRRNERNSNQFKLLARHLVVVPGLEYQGQHPRMVRLQFYINKMIKMQYNTRDYPDGQQDEAPYPDNVGMYLTVRSDLGNKSVDVSSSNENVAIATPNTGTEFNFAITTKYYDN